MHDPSNIAPEPARRLQEPATRLSAAELATILRLHGQGSSARSIAAEIGRSASAVAQAIRDGQRRATRAAVREQQYGLVLDAKRRRDRDRKRRQRERDRLRIEADARAQREREARVRAGLPVGPVSSEPESERKAQVWLHGAGKFTDSRGNDLRLHRPPKSHRIQSGLEGVLNRNDRAREQRARDRALGLDDYGMASVRVLNADGKTVQTQGFDPTDPSDVARAARVTRLPEWKLSRCAHDPETVRELREGVVPGLVPILPEP